MRTARRLRPGFPCRSRMSRLRDGAQTRDSGRPGSAGRPGDANAISLLVIVSLTKHALDQLYSIRKSARRRETHQAQPEEEVVRGRAFESVQLGDRDDEAEAEPRSGRCPRRFGPVEAMKDRLRNGATPGKFPAARRRCPASTATAQSHRRSGCARRPSTGLHMAVANVLRPDLRASTTPGGWHYTRVSHAAQSISSANAPIRPRRLQAQKSLNKI